MPNSANVKFNEVDQSFFVSSILTGLAAVSVQTLRGPYGHNSQIITSWPEFAKLYGGEVVGMDGPTQVKRALSRGAKLRINKVGHYTTISNPSTLDAVKATINDTVTPFAVDGVVDLFNLLIKNAGADYNNLVVQILASSNGDPDAFNLSLTHTQDSVLNELYENIKIPTGSTPANSTYLKDVSSKSQLVDVVYFNTTAAVTPVRPVNGTWSFAGGTNGGVIVDADYVGDAAGTGFNAFDKFDDFEVVAALDRDTTAVLTGGALYAKNREDCVFFGHLPNSNLTTTALQAARAATNVDTRFAAFFAGGLKIPSPFYENQFIDISELGDVVGAAMRSSAEFGPWWSFAGVNRGFIDNAVGVLNNFVELAKQNELAQRQINIVVNIGGQIYIKGNFSAQMASSRKSFLNVVKLIIYIKKSLRPTLERYLEQPNDFRTFREIYNEVQPFLDSLVGNEKRALIDYDWRGDQYANQESDLKINTPQELAQGKYKVELWMKEVVSLQEFTINLISAPSGVSFE